MAQTRTTKRKPQTPAPQVKMTKFLSPEEIEDATDLRKQELVELSLEQASHGTVAYWKWFNAQINDAAWESKQEPDVREAWIRARELFFVLAPIALQNLAESVAWEVTREYKHVPEVGSNVRIGLCNYTFDEILKQK